jgi:hypothetical protein
VTVDYEPEDILLGNEPRVDVLVAIPRDLAAPPDLAQRLDDHLTAEFDRDVVVRVGFIEAQISEDDPPEPVTDGQTVSDYPAGDRSALPAHFRSPTGVLYH